MEAVDSEPLTVDMLKSAEEVLPGLLTDFWFVV